ncbi:hypothetical protein GGS23DRAFT_566844 [Durotheca rogersii]|uniref:uncharacterized protein n=1 Tax=Durotheca rogersii TaxID=419775 RepID=UPI00221F548D|nr:uncharacterized protein GGS23DRAFT_566844 [Durotheca rogersii]KAI5863420.1 hypothetical protein GGS23DRAFT_566844 [Durotheca rogersii]
MLPPIITSTSAPPPPPATAAAGPLFSSLAITADRPAPSSTGPYPPSPADARPRPSAAALPLARPDALAHPSPENVDTPPSDSNGDSQPLLPGHGHLPAHPAADLALQDQRTKKRRTGPSSRGVANLTPEQLAKKRANDREAQRAIRERTRNQIEALERRIRELTSQQPYQELQAAIRAKEAVEAENADIKNRLASVMSLIQPVLSSQQAEVTYASPFTNFAPTQVTQHSPSTHTTFNTSTPASAASPASAPEPPWQAQMQTQSSPNSSQVKLLNQQRHDLLHNLDLGAGEQLKLDFLLDPSQRVSRMQTGVNGAQDTPEYRHLPMKHDWNANVLPSPRTNTAAGSAPPQLQRIEYVSQNAAPAPEEPPWVGNSAPIKNSAPTCPLDTLLLEFLHERRQRAAEGVPTREVVGPRYPSVSSLLNPANSALSHPLSKVFTDILAAFPGISTLPERVAVLYIMFLIMRWQVSPTRENWELLPPWVTPTPAQLEVPHPAWIDHLPFPRMREALAREHAPGRDPAGVTLFDNFFIPFTLTISLNWPYEATDALLRSPDGAELIINPVFERHLRRLENWSLGEAFDRTFPRLRGTYNLKSDTPHHHHRQQQYQRVGGGGGGGEGGIDARRAPGEDVPDSRFSEG